MAYEMCERKNDNLFNRANAINKLFEQIIQYQIDAENDKIKPELKKTSEIIPEIDALNNRLNLLLEADLEQMKSETLITLLYELESKILSELFNNKSKNDFTFNKLKPVVVPNKNIFKAGEILKAEIMVAAFDTMLPPIYKIEGREIETVNGRGIFRIKTSKPGKYETEGSVSILRENDGTMLRHQFNFEYEVEK